MNFTSLAAAGAALLTIGGAAQAQVVITSLPTPGAAGAPGLNGTFYFTNGAPITTISMAQAYMAANSATGTFTATEAGITGSRNGFGYFAHDADSAAQFLQVGDDGKSYSGPTTTLDDGLFDFRGYLDVTAPGTLPLSLFSDDGSALYIGGQQVLLNDGVHVDTQVNGSATFALAGLYPVDVVYFNHVTPDFQNTGALEVDFGGDHLSQLSPAPELSGVAAFWVGMLGLGALAVKARRRIASLPA